MAKDTGFKDGKSWFFSAWGLRSLGIGYTAVAFPFPSSFLFYASIPQGAGRRPIAFVHPTVDSTDDEDGDDAQPQSQLY